MATDDTAVMALMRWPAFRNPAAWYIRLGVLLLALSLWLPFLTASRTSRVEERAEAIASCLLEAGTLSPRPLDEMDVATVLARFHALATRDRINTSNLVVLDAPLPGTLLTLRNKHFLFHLAVSSPDPRETPSRDSVPGYEVMAWPRSSLGPGHSVFYMPQDAIPAYTRNLARGYHGEEAKRAQPGCGQRIVSGEHTTAYRGADDQRWIVLPPRSRR